MATSSRGGKRSLGWRYTPTFAEWLRYWEPSGDDPITLVLAGAYAALMAVGFIVS